MIGAIIGDIVGSPYEGYQNEKIPSFWHRKSFY